MRKFSLFRSPYVRTFKTEDQKFVAFQNTFEDYQHEMSIIEKVFVELLEFSEISNDAQVLVKIEDISEFIKRSFEKLEKMAHSSLKQKDSLKIRKDLKPFIVDTQKSILMVNQFELVPPSKDAYNAFDLKFLREKVIPLAEKTENPTFLRRRSSQ